MRGSLLDGLVDLVVADSGGAGRGDGCRVHGIDLYYRVGNEELTTSYYYGCP